MLEYKKLPLKIQNASIFSLTFLITHFFCNTSSKLQFDTTVVVIGSYFSILAKYGVCPDIFFNPVLSQL